VLVYGTAKPPSEGFGLENLKYRMAILVERDITSRNGIVPHFGHNQFSD
jgi:hypothetical protein